MRTIRWTELISPELLGKLQNKVQRQKDCSSPFRWYCILTWRCWVFVSSTIFWISEFVIVELTHCLTSPRDTSLVLCMRCSCQSTCVPFWTYIPATAFQVESWMCFPPIPEWCSASLQNPDCLLLPPNPLLSPTFYFLVFGWSLIGTDPMWQSK